MSGAEMSVNSSVSGPKNRKNRTLLYQYLVFANKSFDNINL